MSDIHKDQLEALTEIRSLMERSTRFISLSGLTGVFAGVYALVGAGAAYWQLKINVYDSMRYAYLQSSQNAMLKFLLFFFIDAGIVLALTLLTAIYFTTKKASEHGQSIFDKAALRLAAHLFFPLGVGGVFCVALLNYGLFGLIAPSMLIFYGLGLINASKFTFENIRYLGLAEVTLGLIASFITGNGLFFWSIGFGVFHIVYGVYMYIKFDK
jgi:hypothetical protein